MRRSNDHVHLTADQRAEASSATRRLLEMGYLQGRLLDFGCGHGTDVQFLQKQCKDAVGYDPHYSIGRAREGCKTPAFKRVI